MVGWLLVLCLMVEAWSGGLVGWKVGVALFSYWLASLVLQALALAAAGCPGCLAALVA